MSNPNAKPPAVTGSRKGRPNKNTAAIKDMILNALEKAGGVEYLTEQARKNPGPFLALVGKIMPLQLTGDANNPITIQIVQFGAEA